MSRRAAAALGLVLVALFLLVSAGLARVLAVNGAERTAIADLVQAQARGDARELARLVRRCVPSCAALARRLRRPGRVELLRLDPSARFTPAGGRGTTRVAWRAGDALPVVQCVRVNRTGDVVAGFALVVERVGPPLRRDAGCG